MESKMKVNTYTPTMAESRAVFAQMLDLVKRDPDLAKVFTAQVNLGAQQ